MNGIHDIGGMHGLGAIDPESDEPVFHAEWERRMFALWMAAFAAGIYNDNEFRHAIECMAPADYLTTSYYEHWLESMERVMIDKNQFDRAELEAAWAPGAGAAVAPRAADRAGTGGGGAMSALTVDQVIPLFMGGASARVDADVAAKFKTGDAVIARNINPPGHTRLPRYVRGKRGVIAKDHGVFGFPDSIAHGQGDAAQHVYSVGFSAREVWGDGATPRDSFYLEMWDDYLDPAG